MNPNNNQPNYNPYNQPPPPQYPQQPPQPPYQPPPQNNYPPPPPPPMDHNQISKGGALKIILKIATPLIVLVLSGVIWRIYLTSGNEYAKAGIECEKARFDSSEFEENLREEVEAAVSAVKVCSYEGDEWELYKTSDVSKMLQIVAKDIGRSESDVCREESWRGETIVVGSDAFIGANATGSLQDALEAGGFKVTDFKPDFC